MNDRMMDNCGQERIGRRALRGRGRTVVWACAAAAMALMAAGVAVGRTPGQQDGVAGAEGGRAVEAVAGAAVGCVAPPGSPDCDGNGVPDECEIDQCPGLPSCDDCNLNGVPDGCDITDMTSLDVDLNGVPDECVFYDDGGVGTNWSTPENWTNDDTPNNLDLQGPVNVTIGTGQTVDLDLLVEVETCRLLSGSALRVSGGTGEDFRVASGSGMRVGATGFLPSRLLAGGARVLDLSAGKLRVEGAGAVGADPAFAGSVEATLMARDLTIDKACGDILGGDVTLSESMVGDVTRNVVISVPVNCGSCASCTFMLSAGGVARASFGGETPPILRLLDSASIRIGGDFQLSGPGAVDHRSTGQMVVQGSFVNEGTCPACFRMDGPLVFEPPPPGAGVRAGGTQQFEAAGLDLGPAQAGFVSNYALASIEASAGSAVEFVDLFSNRGLVGTEAVYVRTLVLRAGATVTLSGVPVYYESLIDEGAVINALGGGRLAAVGSAPVPMGSTAGLVGAALLIVLAGVGAVRGRRSDIATWGGGC